MKQYSIFHVPLLSFFSKALYRDACFNWKGTGFGYLLLLLALCWIAPMVRVHQGLATFVDQEAPKVISQIPEITILDGKASIREPQPHHIVDPETGKVLVVIDTTGKTTSLAEVKDAVGLVTQTEAIFKKSQFETRSFSFEEVSQFTLNQDRINAWLATGKRFVAPVLYPFGLLGSFVARIIQVLIYALIGLLFAILCKSRRYYIELIRLSVVALTPVIIIKAIAGATQTQIPMAGLWYFLGAMAFLFFGVRAAAHPPEVAE